MLMGDGTGGRPMFCIKFRKYILYKPVAFNILNGVNSKVNDAPKGD